MPSAYCVNATSKPQLPFPLSDMAKIKGKATVWGIDGALLWQGVACIEKEPIPYTFDGESFTISKELFKAPLTISSDGEMSFPA